MSTAVEPNTLYLGVVDTDTKEISISAFPMDHPDYESYHMVLKETQNPRTPVDTTLNILRNVIAANGVKVILE